MGREANDDIQGLEHLCLLKLPIQFQFEDNRSKHLTDTNFLVLPFVYIYEAYLDGWNNTNHYGDSFL
jgi:hypothetical protein